MTVPQRFALRTTTELAKVAGRPIVLLPVGAVEQHGPHLPLGVDIWLATKIADAVAEKVPGIMVAEPLPYGTSAHHRAFSGTLSLRQATYIQVLSDLGRCLSEDGFFPVFFNGHGGNRPALAVGVATLGEEGHRSAAITYFEHIQSEVLATLPDGMGTTGHAGALETSLMMHLFAETVRQGCIPANGTPENWPDPHLFCGPAPIVWRAFEELNPTGIIGKPADASPEFGATLFDAAVRENARVLTRMQTALSNGEWPL